MNARPKLKLGLTGAYYSKPEVSHDPIFGSRVSPSGRALVKNAIHEDEQSPKISPSNRKEHSPRKPVHLPAIQSPKAKYTSVTQPDSPRKMTEDPKASWNSYLPNRKHYSPNQFNRPENTSAEFMALYKSVLDDVLTPHKLRRDVFNKANNIGVASFNNPKELENLERRLKHRSDRQAKVFREAKIKHLLSEARELVKPNPLGL